MPSLASLPHSHRLTTSCVLSGTRQVLATVLTLLLAATASANSTEPAAAASSASAVFTDSSAAGLSATKRVAITNVMISFQASVGAITSMNGLLAHKSDTSTIVEMSNADPKLLAAITDEIYAQLKADLTANGFEVLPEATVVASPSYQKIIKLAGISNFSKFLNRDGDTMLVGATGLKPYLPYNSETGSFSSPPQNGMLLKGWVSPMGMKSSTEGGPSMTSIATIYQLPGLEVALAKELNAHVVKATYLVTLGKTTAGISGRFTDFNTHAGEAFVQVGIRADQSRIAFRTPNGNAKWQSIARVKVAPAKDGDVVITLAQPLRGGSGFFNVQSTNLGKTSFSGGADMKFFFTVTIANAKAYQAEVTGLIKAAQKDLLALVKQ